MEYWAGFRKRVLWNGDTCVCGMCRSGRHIWNGIDRCCECGPWPGYLFVWACLQICNFYLFWFKNIKTEHYSLVLIELNTLSCYPSEVHCLITNLSRLLKVNWSSDSLGLKSINNELKSAAKLTLSSFSIELQMILFLTIKKLKDGKQKRFRHEFRRSRIRRREIMSSTNFYGYLIN